MLKFQFLNGLQDHSDAVNALTLHATGNYFVTASADRTWAFYDVATGTCFTQARLPSLARRFTLLCCKAR